MTDDPAEGPQSRHLRRVATTAYPAYVNRWALLVGISTYQNERLNLQYAHRDAEALYELLRTPSGGGFEPEKMVLLTNEAATTREITRALRSFLKKPAREDVVLLYFACHGTPDADRPQNVYLLTHDTDPDDVAGTALPMREIDLMLRETLTAERVVILADTCHSAAIGGGPGRRSTAGNEAVAAYLQKVSESKQGVALLTSAEANETSMEDKRWGGGHGVFTHFLLEGMRGKAAHDGVVTVGRLFEYVRDSVQAETGFQQHPAIGTTAFDRNLPMAITAGVDAREHFRLGCHLYDLGRRLSDEGRFASAQQHLQEAIRLAKLSGTPFPEAHFHLGLAAMAAGDAALAVTAWERALQEDQDNSFPDTRYHLGMAHARLGDGAAAAQALAAFAAAHPDEHTRAWLTARLPALASGRGARRALLVGVGAYAQRQFSLLGPPNDALALARTLTERFSFPQANIALLTDADATGAGIRAALDTLASQCQPGDEVLFFYAGHAALDPAPSEPYLFPHDIEAGLSAEGLAEAIRRVPGRKTLVLDTHASTAFNALIAATPDCSLFVAASPGEQAYEALSPSGETHGAFTLELLRALESAGNPHPQPAD